MKVTRLIVTKQRILFQFYTRLLKIIGIKKPPVRLTRQAVFCHLQYSVYQTIALPQNIDDFLFGIVGQRQWLAGDFLGDITISVGHLHQHGFG